jgi:hypothetical protein
MKQCPGEERRMETYAAVSEKHPEFLLLQLFRFQTKYHESLKEASSNSIEKFKRLDTCIFHCHGKDSL